MAPRALWIEGPQLLVCDYGNSRVLIWNSLPTMNGQPADIELGQLNFTSAYNRPDRTHIGGPAGLLVKNGRLYVSAFNQNRILYWNQIPIASNARADGVLGQGDFLSAVPNNGDVPPIERLSAPIQLASYGDQLLVADFDNNRVVVRALPQ